MRRLGSLLGLARRLWRREEFENNLNDELRFHLEERADHLERTGLTRAEAVRRARLELGGLEGYKEECRQASGLRFFDDLVGDVRYAVRGLRRDPSYTCIAVLVLGLALGANTALFTFLNAYFLRSLPISGADRHVELAAFDPAANQGAGGIRRGFTREEIGRLTSGAAIEHGYGSSVARLTVEAPEPVRTYVETVTGGYFPLVRPRVLFGRTFGAEADRPGAAERVAVLSHPGWRRLTGGDPKVVGRPLRIHGEPFTVIGVLDASWQGLEPVTPDFWIPAAAYEALAARTLGGAGSGPALYNVSGLLRPGLSLEQAGAQFSALLPAPEVGPGKAETREAVQVRLRTTLLREQEDLEPLAAALLVAFALVVLVAAANLTNLQLARAAARSRDLALRLSLGASRSRLVRQLVTESLVVSVLGGAAGFALAAVGLDFIQRRVFSVGYDAGLHISPVGLDGWVFLYTFVLAAACGALCGLLPALDATRPGFAPRLGLSGAGFSGPRPRRLRDALIVGQVAVSLALLVAAGVLLRNAARAGKAPTGFEVESLVDLRLDRPTAAVLDRIAADPRFLGATAAMRTPLSGRLPRVGTLVAGQGQPLKLNRVDHRYFELLGIPIRRGRAFTAAEAASQVRRAVVSEATARRLWPGKDPLGQTVEVPGEEGDFLPPGRYEVVGVAGDAMSEWFFEGFDDTMLYLPAALGTVNEVLVRTRGTSAGAEPRLEEICRQLGGAGGYCEPTTLRQMLALQRFPFAVGSGIASGLGVLALGFACLGLYGLVSFTVVRRTKEIGVRIALGATRGNVVGGFLLEALRRVGIGVAVGLPICLGLSALAASKLVMLEMMSAVVYTVVPLALFAAALAAAFVPARRAAGVDPLVALRQD